jgi:hexosaminidase
MLNNVQSIPKPMAVRYQAGEFRCSGLPEICGDEYFGRVIETVRGQLAHDFCAGALRTEAGKRIVCSKVSGLEDEAYRLRIGPTEIRLGGSSERGVYHGLQTVRQWILSAYRDGTLVLPCAEVEDAPRFPWRGFMLDTSRHFYTVSFIKKLIDALSLHHINVFHWHLTDDQGWRLPVDAYPLLTEIGSKRLEHCVDGLYTEGSYTEDEIRDVVAYAAARQVEVVPEVNFPGHTSSVLAAYPGLGCTGGPYRVEDRFGIFEDVLCAGNDALFELAAAVFDTLARLFPSSYVHIGGDEVLFNRWGACPKCRRRMRELGLERPNELQSWITMRLVRMLAERGKTAIGWDEVLEDSERFRLPKELVVMSWRGTEGGIQAGNRGYQVIMAPNTKGCYLDQRHLDDPDEPGRLGISSVYDTYSVDPVQGISPENAASVMGGQGNLWTEVIYAAKIAEYMIFPRICALAEALWTPVQLKDFEDFSQRLPAHRERLDMLGLAQYRGPLVK